MGLGKNARQICEPGATPEVHVCTVEAEGDSCPQEAWSQFLGFDSNLVELGLKRRLTQVPHGSIAVDRGHLKQDLRPRNTHKQERQRQKRLWASAVIGPGGGFALREGRALPAHGSHAEGEGGRADDACAAADQRWGAGLGKAAQRGGAGAAEGQHSTGL